MSLGEARQTYYKQRDQIESIAQELRIALKLRISSEKPKTTSTLKRGPVVDRSEWSSDSETDVPDVRTPGPVSIKRRRTAKVPPERKTTRTTDRK